MKTTALNCIIPAQVSVEFTEGAFELKKLKRIHADAGLDRFSAEAAELCASFAMPTVQTADSNAELVIRLNPELGKESWSLCVTERTLTISGGDDAGIFYGLSALAQIFATAAIRGTDTGVIECGMIKDSPRFYWRGLMLDSARHCQSKETVKAVIRMIAAYRLNVFHWHLTDNQGWRIHTGSVPRSASLDLMSSGYFTKEDLQEVAAYAKKYFVQIVPEIDVPGHSFGILNTYPEFACDHGHPGNEFCIGNEKTLPFLKKLFAELFEIFPDSKYIHFGGDEADLTYWEKCPRCQAAMKRNRFKTLRELENHFMVELTRFAVANGRTPIVWGSDAHFPPDTVIQNWLHIRDPFLHIKDGNNMIMSIHASYYLDYPAGPSEPAKTWMVSQTAENMYMADPYIVWEDSWKGKILGSETCLWTEIVPEWRVTEKILPRLSAYSETSWSLPERKNWFEFQQRRDILRSAGYEDYLRFLSR